MEPATQSGTAMQTSSVLRVFLVIRLGTRGDYRSAEGGVKANAQANAQANGQVNPHANGANWRAACRCATLA